jgi:hypothetical protein
VRGARAARLVAVALLAALAAGCRLDATVGVSLEPDGSGTFEVVLAADRALVAQAAAAGADPLASLADDMTGLPGWDVATGETGGGRRTVLRATFAGPADFARLTDQFEAALGAPELDVLGPLRLELGDDRLRVRGSAALIPTPQVRELGLTERQAVDTLAEAVRYDVRVRMPGAVLDSNADEQDGGELRWIVPAGETVEFQADGARPGSPLPLLVAGGLLAALVSAWALRRSPRPVPAPVARDAF